MSWLILSVLVVGSICGLFNAWRESIALPETTDDEFNHSEGEDDHVE